MEGNTNLNPPIPPSANSEEILEKLETIIEKMEEPKEASVSTSTEEYKITIMVTTIAHGEKIILRPQLKNLEEFEDYENELKSLPWYTFVEKTYIYGYAPFGNVCLISNNPSDIWSRTETKRGIQKNLNSTPIDTTNRNTFVKTVSKANANFINEQVPVSGSETSQTNPRGAIMAKMFQKDKDVFSHNMPIKGIMNPMTMRLEIVPSVYVLSGKNTDRIEEALEEDPHTFMASQDRFSGIFVSVLSDNRGNTFTFPSLFNLADGKHIMEIFQRLEIPIPDVDGVELYEVIRHYVDYWNNTYTSGSNMLIIKYLNVGYHTRDKTTGKLKTSSYFILTQLNTMSVYVLSNLVFDFLVSKKQNPMQAYKKDNIGLWVEELKQNNSKIINISTACEAVNPEKMDYSTIEDIAAHINDNSLRRTPTQIETGENGPDTIDFDDLDDYISKFGEKIGGMRRRTTKKKYKKSTNNITTNSIRTNKRITRKKYKKNRNKTRTKRRMFYNKKL